MPAGHLYSVGAVVADGKVWKKRHAVLRVRGAFARTVLLATTALALAVGSAPDYLHRRVEQLAARHSWSVVDWELRHLGAGLVLVVGQVVSPPDVTAARDRLAQLFRQRGARDLTEPGLQRALAAAVTDQLRASGVPTLGGAVFPPVAFSVGEPPSVVVVSPRSEIRLAEAVLLDEGISLEAAQAVETAVERLNVSALVERTGGLSTYPTLVAPETDAFRALQTIAHEWTHTALFFAPLGRAYGSNAQARAINETAADIVGQEVAERIAESIGERPPRQGGGGVDRVLSDRLRRIRVNVERLLALGAVDEAEAYMEQERVALAAQGYAIRRLNQAFFAFHGNYAEGPAASTEIPDALRALRAQSASLGEFVERVGQVTTVAELKRMLAP